MGMMTNKEQIAALKIVGEKVAAAVCNYYIKIDRGDVACLYADVPNPSEITCPILGEGYDVWTDGKLTKPDLDANEAAKVVILEYKAHKIHLVMCNLIGEDWKSRINESRCRQALDHVASQVAEIELQREYSEHIRTRN
jgi:hypothetical protein